MDRVTLYGTDLQVSPVCVGCWQFNDGVQTADKTWGAQPYEVSKAIVDAALENGINFFDTAQGYKNSEDVLGRALEGRRNDVIIATKFGTMDKPKFTPEDIEAAVTQSLRQLKTDHIDLYQVHWPSFVRTDMQGCVDELKRQQARGRIRYYGVSNFGPKDMQQFMAAGGKPATNQLSYSLLWRPIEYDILPVCQENNIGILCYSALQQGLLSGNYRKPEDLNEGRRRTRLFNASGSELCRHGEEGAEKQMFQAINDIAAACEAAGVSMPSACLSWCLKQPPVQAVIVGARTADQVSRNARLASLSQELLQKLTDVTTELKETIGNAPDMWSHESRIA